MLRKIEFTKGYLLFYILLIWVASGCANKSLYQASTERSSIAINSEIEPDEEILEIIEPYKIQLAKTMDEVIGYSESEIVKQKGESALGNFVADAILKKSREARGKEIDMAAITIGGLRNPIPKGEIMLKTVYELMPFENSVYVLTLTGEQTRLLFEYLAENQNIAIANTVVILRDNKIVNVFIGGKIFDEKKTYTLAISDYLAGGGDHMTFLKDAEITTKLPLKVRDLIIEEIRQRHAKGQKIKSTVEGRVKFR